MNRSFAIPRTLVLTFAASVLAATANRAGAEDIVWDGATGPFSEATNWVGDVVPTNVDAAILDNGGTAQISSGDSFTVSQLRIDDGAIVQTGGFFSADSTLSGDGLTAFNVGSAAEGTGTYSASGNSQISGGRVRIGVLGGTGVMNLSDDAVYNGVAGRDTWLGQGLGSTGTLNLSDRAQWNLLGDALVVARSEGTGTLNMVGDSVLTGNGNDIYLGAGNGSTATVELSGNSRISWTGGNIRGGQGGTATITLNNNASMIAETGEIWIGNDGGNGTLNLNGNSRAETKNHWLVIGRNGGTGTATVSGTSQLVKTGGNDRFLAVGNGGGGTGTLTVKDDGVVSSNTSIRIGSEGGTGTLDVQDNATVNSGGEFWIGALNANSKGTVNLSGGSITSANWIAVGRDGSKGILNMTGGTLTNAGSGAVGSGNSLSGSNFTVNGSEANVAEVHHSGGTIDNSNAVLLLAEDPSHVVEWETTGGSVLTSDLRIGFGGRATMTIGGTGSVTTQKFYMGAKNTGSGVLNLNAGGTLTTNYISEGAGENNTINFNGGTVRAAIDRENFIEDFEAGEVTIQAGGLKFDTNGHTVSFGYGLGGEGGLTKLGAGTLTLNAINTYAGPTEIQGGTVVLGVTGAIALSSEVILSGGTLNLNNFSETLAALTLDGSSTINFGSLNGENILTFADSSSTTWTGTLTLENFEFGVDILSFSSASGLTQDQLSQIALSGYTATGLDGNGNVVFEAVPEPSTVALLIAGGAGALFFARRRRLA